MYQEFYRNTIQSNFIKYILQQTYIPTVPFTCNINHVTKDCTYIDNGYFVKAKVSQDLNDIRDRIAKGSLYQNYFTKFAPYIFGKQYIGLTTNYESNTDVYDPETHFYLGQYLKAYKAYYNIDLFPYYNCFSDEYLSGVSLIKKDSMPFVECVDKADPNYKIVSIPISLCQEYTIAIDCPSEVIMCPVFVGKKGILEEQTRILQSSLLVAPHPMVHEKSNYIFNQLSFNNPVYFFSPCIPGVYDKAQLALPQYEKYLRLLIRLPIQNSSTITVLQGHFRNVKSYQNKLMNLDLTSISEQLKDIVEVDYLADTTYDEIYSDTELIHYGNLENIIKTYPSILTLNPISTTATGQKQINTALIEQNKVKIDLKTVFTTTIPNLDIQTNLLYPLPKPKFIIAENNISIDLLKIYPGISEIKFRAKTADGLSAEFELTTNKNTISISDIFNSSQEVTIDGLRIQAVGGKYTITTDDTTNYTQLFLDSEWNIVRINSSNEQDTADTGLSNDFEPTIFDIKPLLKEGIYQITADKSNFDIIIDNKSLRNDYLILKNTSDWTSPVYIEVEESAKLIIPYGTSFQIISDQIEITDQEDLNNLLLNYRSIIVKDINIENVKLDTTDKDVIKIISSDSKQQIQVKQDLSDIKFNYIDWINYKKLTNNNTIDNSLNIYLNKYLYNNLSLLYLNDHVSYAFVSRLFEYLLNNVITNNDQFIQNIKTTQIYADLCNKLGNKRFESNIYSDGIWTPELRIAIFEAVNNYKKKQMKQTQLRDINGFVDKDTEKAIQNFYYILEKEYKK